MHHIFDLPSPPARFFYNRFWMHKLIRCGWSYVDAGLIAQDLAQKCYLAPYDVRAQILRKATAEYCRLPAYRLKPPLRSKTTYMR